MTIVAIETIRLCAKCAKFHPIKRPMFARTHKCEQCGRPARYVIIVKAVEGGADDH